MRKLLVGAITILLGLGAESRLLAEDKEHELLDKAIKAQGGADNLNKYKGVVVKVKGKLHILGQALDFTGTFAGQRPDRMRNEITFAVMGKTLKVITVLNKNKGWQSVDGTTMEMSKDELAEAREEIHANQVADQLTPLKDKAYKLSALGEIKIDGKPAVGLCATRQGYRDVNLYFDKKTALLVKVETRVKDLMAGGKEITQESIYRDYKDIQGIKMPMKMDMKRDGKDFITGDVSEIKLSEKLSDDLFTKPRSDQ